MKYAIIIKSTKKVCHTFIAVNDQDALIKAKSFLKGFSLDYKKYKLISIEGV